MNSKNIFCLHTVHVCLDVQWEKNMPQRTHPVFSDAVLQQLLHGRVPQPCGSKPSYFGMTPAGDIQWLKGMCSHSLACIKADISQPVLFVYHALPRKAVPTTPVATASPSNEDTPPGAGPGADPRRPARQRTYMQFILSSRVSATDC